MRKYKAKPAAKGTPDTVASPAIKTGSTTNPVQADPDDLKLYPTPEDLSNVQDPIILLRFTGPDVHLHKEIIRDAAKNRRDPAQEILSIIENRIL